MKRSLFLILACWVVLSLIACVPKQLYYYGDYSKTLYHHEKNQNNESLIGHQKELEKIIFESKTKKMPVPPGIYAELGFINMKANNSKEAIRLFKEESNLYPESILLMDRLISNVQAREKNENKSSEDFSLSNDNTGSEKVMIVQTEVDDESTQLPESSSVDKNKDSEQTRGAKIEN